MTRSASISACAVGSPQRVRGQCQRLPPALLLARFHPRVRAQLVPGNLGERCPRFPSRVRGTISCTPFHRRVLHLVHPTRAAGTMQVAHALLGSLCGSPARAGTILGHQRGTLRSPVHPARAGQWPRGLISPGTGRSSPRACGDNGKRRLTVLFCIGSPPRAGTMFRCRHWRWQSTVHPRACGDNEKAVSLLLVALAGSPRVRGQ